MDNPPAKPGSAGALALTDWQVAPGRCAAPPADRWSDDDRRGR